MPASTKNTRFALGVHLLTLLGAADGVAQSSEVLSHSAGSNPVHVRRVLGSLREAGLVASRHGPGGGWTTVGDPATTTLADVWDAVHGDAPVLDLHMAAPGCPVGRAIQDELRAVDRDALRAVRDELARTTLAELVGRTDAAALLAG